MPSPHSRPDKTGLEEVVTIDQAHQCRRERTCGGFPQRQWGNGGGHIDKEVGASSGFGGRALVKSVAPPRH
jgi:hypothetical protein